MADGSDIIPVYFKICDRKGTLINQSNARIQISVSGEGALVGDGIERIALNPQTVEGGIGYALIRTTRRPGKITLSVSADGLIEGRTEFTTEKYKGSFVPDGDHAPYTGNEEEGVVIKPTTWENTIRTKTPLNIHRVLATSEQKRYVASNIIDGDDTSWWIADNASQPQVITLELNQTEPVFASRIRFQKDSSAYAHQVETSTDGVHWNLLYERECTGWDFKPVRIQKELRFLRITITKSSEGAPGLAEVTLYK